MIMNKVGKDELKRDALILSNVRIMLGGEFDPDKTNFNLYGSVFGTDASATSEGCGWLGLDPNAWCTDYQDMWDRIDSL